MKYYYLVVKKIKLNLIQQKKMNEDVKTVLLQCLTFAVKPTNRGKFVIE